MVFFLKAVLDSKFFLVNLRQLVLHGTHALKTELISELEFLKSLWELGTEEG
jgi:hypothetical protein